MPPENERLRSPDGAKDDFSRAGLASLDDQPLSARNQSMLDEARHDAGGSPVWTGRKVAEARDLLALSELAPQRLRVEKLSLGDALKAVLHMRSPVAVRVSADQAVKVAKDAILGLSYHQQALVEPQPGYAFFCVLQPMRVWHAQVSRFPIQHLCLGDTLPAGIRVKELVLMAYYALSMQTFQIDAGDAAGVLNVAAARWWQQNVDRIPLSRAPFLGDPNLDAEVTG